MEPVAPQLPAAFGSAAALAVACISLLVQTSPTTCLLRAVSAFVVFAAFGIVIRFLLADAAGKPKTLASHNEELSVDEIEPGTSVQDLLTDEP